MRRLTLRFLLASSTVEDNGSTLLPGWEISPVPLPDEFQIAADLHPVLWAWRKATDVISTLPHGDSELPVLGADTIVIGPGEVLGKPKGEGDATRMLETLRGRKHYVATGFVLIQKRGSRLETLHEQAVVSTVWMRNYSDGEIRRYVATGEPLDKAGAYAMQGLGGKLVDRVEGCYNNVVGLPACIVRRVLIDVGVKMLPYPEGGYCAYCPASEV